MKWRLTGTPQEIALAQGAINDIKIPWDRLNITWQPELGWRDLNSGYRSDRIQAVSTDNQMRHGNHYHGDRPLGQIGGPGDGHGHDHGGPYTPENEGPPHPLNGMIDGRRFTYAVYYPGSARIFIEKRLISYPALARASVSAEIAHAFDETLPITDTQKAQIIDLLGGGLDWWERFDYGTEYWRLAGEMWMPIFTNCYSDIPFGNVSSFARDVTKVRAEDIVRIIGIQRTDFVAPVPPPMPAPPPEPVIAPDEEITPMPDPEPVAPTPAPTPTPDHTHEYRVYGKGKSRIVHKPTHYPRHPRYTTYDHIPEGFRPCKVCKPH